MAAWLLAACAPQYLPAGEADTVPYRDGDALVMRDGKRLPVAVWQASGTPGAVLIALHSFGDFRLAFEDIGPALAGRGYTVIAFDQRGFGDTIPHGRWSGAETMIGDLRDAVDIVRGGFGGLPVYVMGESMGGGVALAAAGRGMLPDVDGLILAAPAVREDVTFRYAYKAFLWTAAHILPQGSIHNDRGNARHTGQAYKRLSSDPRIVRDVRIDTYWGLIRLTDLASDLAPEAGLPTLLMHGGHDRVVARKSVRALAGHLGD
ncbi:MAG: alpha/beta fold hydrolase, partial [Rhodospirillales bacterium]